MKLPNGTPTPAPKTDAPVSPPSRPAGEQPLASQNAASARVQLDQLKLANREATLARVAEVINRQTSAGAQLLLDIRGQSLTVQAAIGDTSLETGDWVKVMRAGNELQLMGKLAPAQEAGISRALAQRLPWQQSIDAGLARILATLTTGARPDGGTTTTPMNNLPQALPQPVRQAIEQLAANLPSSQSLAPGAGSQPGAASQLRQWVAESGLFAESRLTRTPDATLPDLKLAIGRIITALLAHQGSGPEGFNRFTPLASPELAQAPLQFPNTFPPPPPQSASEPATVGQMLRLLAGMLNRVTVNQLHSQVLSTRTTAEAPAPVSTMLVELPWLNPNNEPRIAQLRIEQEQAESDRQTSGKSTATEWRLSLAMDLDEAGPLHFDVSLRQDKVSAQVWAEKQSTLRQVREDLPELRQGLADIGLEVVDLECRRGTPRGASTRLEHRLVDTRV